MHRWDCARMSARAGEKYLHAKESGMTKVNWKERLGGVGDSGHP